jgi:hypothetical protein
MGSFTRILPLLLVAATAGCTASPTGVTEERAGNAAVTITSSPSSADGRTDVGGSAGVGADGQAGQDGQDGRSDRGNEGDGKDTGTPPTSSRGPDGRSFSVTNNDVNIGARFGSTPKRFSFGSTSLGSTTTRTVTVGSKDLEATVSSVNVVEGAGVFRILEDGCTGAIFPGPSCSVTLAATPPVEGKHIGVLEIANTYEDTSLDLEVTAETNDRGLSGPTGETPDEESAEPEEPPEESTESE